MALDRKTIPLCLETLGLAGQDWGPDVSSHAALAAGWRGSVACPTEQAMLDVEAAAVAKAAALATIQALEAEVNQRRLREAVLTPEGAAWLDNQETLIAAQRAIISGA